MSQDRTVSVGFSVARLTLDQSSDPSGIVTVSPDPNRSFYSSCRPGCSQQYPSGTVVTLSANETPGLSPRTVFDHWLGACAGQGQTCTLTLDGDKNVDVVWRSGEPQTRGKYTLTLWDSVGFGFAISPPGAHVSDCHYGTCALHYDEGAQISIAPEPGYGYTFDHWSGACAGQPEQCSITISGDTRVEAYWLYTR